MLLTLYICLFAALVLVLSTRKYKNRTVAVSGIALFSICLAALGGMYYYSRRDPFLAALYGIAALSQVLSAYRTWTKWPTGSRGKSGAA
jgi:hypothetical protein